MLAVVDLKMPTSSGRSFYGGFELIRRLKRHDIEVDEVCRHKPPATVYVDDRAIPFSGDWEQTIGDIIPPGGKPAND